MLNNEKFIKRAKQEKIDAEKSKYEDYKKELEMVNTRLEKL